MIFGRKWVLNICIGLWWWIILSLQCSKNQNSVRKQDKSMSYKYFNHRSLIKIVQDHNKTLMVSIHLPVIGALVHFNNCSVSLFHDLSMSSSGLVHLSPEEKDEILRSLSQHPELLRSHHHQQQQGLELSTNLHEALQCTEKSQPSRFVGSA